MTCGLHLLPRSPVDNDIETMNTENESEEHRHASIEKKKNCLARTIVFKHIRFGYLSMANRKAILAARVDLERRIEEKRIVSP